MLSLPVSSRGITGCRDQTGVVQREVVAAAAAASVAAASAPSHLPPSSPIQSHRCTPQPPSNFPSPRNTATAAPAAASVHCSLFQSQAVGLRAVTRIWIHPPPSSVSEFGCEISRICSCRREKLGSSRSTWGYSQSDELAFLNAILDSVELVKSCRNIVDGPDTITENTLDLLLELAPSCEQLFSISRILTRCELHATSFNAFTSTTPFVYLALLHGSSKTPSPPPFTWRAVFCDISS